MTFSIFIMTIFKIETGDLYQTVLTGWAGYGVAKALYYNMAKSDHQIQLIREVDPKADEKIRSIIKDNLVDRLKEAIIQELKTEGEEVDQTKEE